MAENDIYNSKEKYERFEKSIKNKSILKKSKKAKYYCKNPANLKYFDRLMKVFEVDDTSYVRRDSLLRLLKKLTYFIDIDLKDANSLERENVIIQIRKGTKTTQLKRLEGDIRRLGRILFDDDERPCFFKEFKIKVDKNREKLREDKLSFSEFDKLVKYFSNYPLMQAYLTIGYETLARPQELLYIRIKNIDLCENYAYLVVSEHGKEGCKKLLSIDSFPYLLKYFENHIDKDNKEAFLFLNKIGTQLTPALINKHIRSALKSLKINKPITAYSIKRIGVTHRRLKGDSDVTIQRIAGWTSTDQLKTYDLSDQDDVFKKELAKRGLIKDKETKKYLPKVKICPYCNQTNAFGEDQCSRCHHFLDGFLVEKKKKEETSMKKLLWLLLKKEVERNPNGLKECDEELREIISSLSS